MTETIGGIRYNLEEDGDLRQLVMLLVENKDPKNKYEGRKINEILKMLLKDKLDEKLKKGELKDIVTYVSDKLNKQESECFDLIKFGKIEQKSIDDWIESTKVR